MSVDPVVNFAVGETDAIATVGTTSIALKTGHAARFPDPGADGPFSVVWWNYTDYPNAADDPDVEVVRVTAVASDTWTITRAQEGTTASRKALPGRIYRVMLAPTAKLLHTLHTPRVIPIFMMPRGSGSEGRWVNMPAAATELFGETGNRIKADLTRFNELRVVANVITAGYSGAYLYSAYSTNESAWQVLGSGEQCPVDSTSSVQASSWVDIAAGGKADVFIRIQGAAGNGVADPKFGFIAIELR